MALEFSCTFEFGSHSYKLKWRPVSLNCIAISDEQIVEFFSNWVLPGNKELSCIAKCKEELLTVCAKSAVSIA